MKRYKNLLEEALKDIHAREYPMVLDDNLSCHFDNWVSELDPNYIIDVWSSVQTHFIKLLTDTRDDLDKAGLVIGKGVDVTEVPDGLSAEITGMKKGWKASIDQVLLRLDTVVSFKK